MPGSQPRNKVVALDRLTAALEPHRAKKQRLVFTNGCFDLLHTGHTRCLSEAKKLGDILIVGLNSDRSVRAIKGAGRPIRTQEKRAELLAALESVDYVVIFDEDTPLELIRVARPDVLVKGGDWPVEKIVGADLVRAGGGLVANLPYIDGESTTAIIDQILGLASENGD